MLSVSVATRLSALLGALLFGFWSPAPLLGADIVWTNADATTPFNWNLTSSNWSTGVWSNVAVDGAVFGPGGGAGTIQLSTTITARSLAFSANGFTLLGPGPLTLSSGGSSSEGPATIDIFGPTTTAKINVELAGIDGLTKVGSGTVVLQAANSFSGPLVIDGAMAGAATTSRLSLSGNGTLAPTYSGPVTIFNNATLALDNSTTNLFDRVSDSAPITLNGGRIAFTGRALTSSSETFGNLTVSGLAVLSPTAGPNGTAQLTFASVNRVDNGTLFLAGFIGGTPAPNRSNISVGGGFGAVSDPLGPVGGQNTAIVPFVAGNTIISGLHARMLATYDANGVRLLDPSDAAAFNQVTAASTGLAANVNNNLAFAAPDAVTGTIRINSLAVDSSTTLTGGGTLQIYSGTIANNADLTLTGLTVDFGSATGYFHLGAPVSVQTGSVIAGTNGVVVSGLDLGANSTLIFANSAANTFAGGLFINGNATVAFSNSNQLGATGGGLTLAGGTLSLTPPIVATLDSGRTVNVGAAGGTLDVASATGTLIISGGLNGPGSLTKTGLGNLTIAGSGALSGSVTIAGGELTLSSNGMLSSVPRWTVGDGARLRLDDAISVGNRLGSSATVVLNGGEFRLDGGAPSVQDIGALSVGGLSGTITLNPGSGQSAVLNINAGFGSSAFTLFRGTNLGGIAATSSRIFLSGQSTGILTGAVADTDSAGGGAGPAYYDPIMGVRPAQAADFLSALLIRNAGGTPVSADVLAAGAAATGIGAENNIINSLTVGGGGSVTVNNRLTLSSGSLYTLAGTPTTIDKGSDNPFVTPVLDFGAGSARLFTVSDLVVNFHFSELNGSLLKSGPGTVILNQPGQYGGGTVVFAGTLRLGADGITPAGTDLTILNGGVFDAGGFANSIHSLSGNGTLIVGAGGRLLVTGNTLTTYSGALAGGGTLAIGGSLGMLRLTGNSPGFGGTIELAGGVVEAVGPAALGSSTVRYTANSFMQLVAGGNYTNAIVLHGGNDWRITHGSVPGVTTTLGPISGGTAAGTLEFGSNPANTGVFQLSDANTFSGTIYLSGGQLAVTGDGGFGAAGNSINLDALGDPTAPGGLRFDASVSSSRDILLSSSAYLNVPNAGHTVQWNGTISGDPTTTLYKGGNGTLILGGGAGVGGETHVMGGCLRIDGSQPFDGSGITVHAGGTLAGTGRIVQSVTIQSGGTLAPGLADGSGKGALTVDALISVQAGATFHWDFSKAGTGLLVLGSAGDLDLSNAVFAADPAPDFDPTGSSVWFLVDNQTGRFLGTFAGLDQDAEVDIGNYQAHITYLADFSLSSISGGYDVALYGFQDISPVPEPTALLFPLLALSLWSWRRSRP